MYLDNKLYDVLKWIAQYVLPGSATLYFALASIWSLPNTEAVVGTIMAIDVFLGALLGLSSMEYDKAQQMEGAAPLNLISSKANRDIAQSSSILDLSADAYDRIKWFTLILLPASGTLYLAVSNLWGFPFGAEVVGTIAAITAFLGALLGISSSRLKKSLPV